MVVKKRKKRSPRLSTNIYDRAARLAIKLDPKRFFAYVLNFIDFLFRFGRWLDTRMAAFPQEPERICDTVAELIPTSGSHSPLACITEPQGYFDYDFVLRVLGYMSECARQLRCGARRGDRYRMLAVILNLTKKDIPIDLDWLLPVKQTDLPANVLYPTPMNQKPNPSPQGVLGSQVLHIGLHWSLIVINWYKVDGRALLTGIASGTIPACLLVWFPLTIGGDDPELIALWIELASKEKNHLRRSDYGAIALIFAEKAKRLKLWRHLLKGWNVQESKLGREWEKRGEAKATLKQSRAFVLDAVETRFEGEVTEEARKLIAKQKDLTLLKQWFKVAIKAGSFADFCKVFQTNGVA